MTIKDWPEAERPREKLLSLGAAALSDAELLAVFLRTGRRGKTAVDVARELLARVGSLRSVFTASLVEWSATSGLGSAKYAQLHAALELTRRHLRERLERLDTLSDPQVSRDYLAAELGHCEQEVFACLFLDNRHRVLAFEKLFFGSIHCATVHPREVVKRCLYHNAGAVILSHNHPSGVAEPSNADQILTHTLQQALALVDVRVLDHIVVAGEKTVSLAERGLI